jgi:hypothetical protein
MLDGVAIGEIGCSGGLRQDNEALENAGAAAFLDAVKNREIRLPGL